MQCIFDIEENNHEYLVMVILLVVAGLNLFLLNIKYF